MVKDPEMLPESLMHSIVNDQTSDVLLEMSESVLDAATEGLLQNDTLSEIPVLKTVIGVARGALAFRDRRYISKLLRMLAEAAKVSDEDRKQFQEKLDNNPKEAKRAGIVILDIVDKITTNEKAAMVGKLMRAYMHEPELTLEQLINLCEIVERAYLQDLISLEKSETHNDVHLENVGIKKPMRVEDINQVILEAVNQAVEESTSRAGVIKETFTAEQTDGKKLLAQVQQSGFTDVGYELMRILRSYT